MHVLLTGALGRCGMRTLSQLLDEGHTVLATDRTSPSSPLGDGAEFMAADLTLLHDIDALFKHRFDGVIHLGAIPNPVPEIDDRELHANNVVSSYNVMRTAVDHGVRRIVQASSVNAHGLSFAPPGHTAFDRFPITEAVERRDEDAYATSKHECEVQASALVRYAPGTRIASLRPHMVRDDYASAYPDTEARDIFSWVSYAAVARAAVLALTSEGWGGHEVFNIVAPEICWEGSVEEQYIDKDGEPPAHKVGTLELVRKYWPNVEVDEEYWRDRPRRAVWDSSKAERLLGWRHE
ncbi:NAD(P)-binding protein [Cutaneotrichosporon oleaginosum]|uniref:NAD(P)-binding protein n=1 Tax=Cutaneotrichosporon oleaginosum TaxID=879819 RepID=A0A0J1B8P9_9TREE|nr:NAD(P)-binding protein [Cutaneotrichosporon oleaginosum]KLT44154.1 NAD(P)-binding protein [Cutaneotrichosporon oleaginosum]TXT09391.1 hypothetical protein COLE_03325 [Cutaneotrichosporon oleaginosum]